MGAGAGTEAGGADGLMYNRVGIHARAATRKQRPNGRRETPSFPPTVKSVGRGANRLLLLFLNQCPPEWRQPSAEGEGTRLGVCPWTGNPGGQSKSLVSRPSRGGLVSKESACSAGDPGSIPGSGTSPGEGNGNPLSSIRAWRMPWTEELDGLQSTGVRRVKRDRVAFTFYFHSGDWIPREETQSRGGTGSTCGLASQFPGAPGRVTGCAESAAVMPGGFTPVWDFRWI